MKMMHKNKSVSAHNFSMVPRADIPRSQFKIEMGHKTTFDAGYLIPVFVDEVLPGDSINLSMTAFCRLSTPIYPIMDNLHLDTFFFFVPNRIIWDNWEKFMGSQNNPGDSISYLVPQITSPAGGYAVGSIFDYMGLPTVGQVTAGATISHNALHLRAYNLIWNQWFRDENLQNSVVVDLDDGPDPNTDYTLLRRGKRHDYFTSALPWPQKGAAVTLPLGSTASIKWDAQNSGQAFDNQFVVIGRDPNTGTNQAQAFYNPAYGTATGNVAVPAGQTANMYADLSSATAATINQLRESFQIQKLLERDARGGTRYTEIIRSHFGVVSPDARLQRPEYIGGGSTPILIQPIPQQSATNITGGSTPLGNLGGVGTGMGKHGFSQSFTEHGVIIGLCSVRADLNYQQGMRKMWSRRTRYDFYFPVFAYLGEQPILNREIYATGSATDANVFGYQERWAEYRYKPSLITGLFRSTSAGTLDAWHLAQRFTSLPTLNSTFIQDTPPVDRVVAIGAAANGKQFIFDSFFSIKAARPMPLYSVPGLIDHF